jgi:putative peptidoglycan lipid II flippase
MSAALPTSRRRSPPRRKNNRARRIAGAHRRIFLKLEVPRRDDAGALPLIQYVGRFARHPIVRGGAVIGAGILAGNVLGFGRSAVTAYLLGTRATADGLAVALGPIDTLNSVLINTVVFAFVPLLTSQRGSERAALYGRSARLLTLVFCCVAAAITLFAPALIRMLGPGLDRGVYPVAVNLLRVSAISAVAAGASAIGSALLYTERRFGPSAFNQAVVNLFVIGAALLLWRSFGVYAFAIGYVCGTFVQLGIVWRCARGTRQRLALEPVSVGCRKVSTARLLSAPAPFLIYAALLGGNVIITRAFATESGPGMAAAFDYSLRCVSVLIAYLVSPASNSLLPEMAKMQSEGHGRDAFRLLERTLGLVAIAAVVSCAIGLAIRTPVMALLFERGSFTSESTELVSEVFLGFAPCLVGWSLIEITARSLFALDRPWLPVITAAIAALLNIAISAALRGRSPETVGVGASVGMLVGFIFLFVMLLMRQRRAMRLA